MPCNERFSWMISFGLVAFICVDLWFCVSQKAHEPLMRHLAASSGEVDNLVNGGIDFDEHAKALSKPPDYSLPFPTVWEYFAALRKWNPDGEPSIPDGFFTSVDPSVTDLEAYLPAGYTQEAVNESLAGLWCGPTHPSSLACFIPFASNLSAGSKRLPAQGFLAGYMFMWDSPGARNTLEFFSRYALEFQFPKWYDSVDVGQGSSIWTLGRRPFSIVPYPAAVYEGLPEGHLYRMRKITGNMFWDASASSDPAVCFCSVRMQAPNVIVRNNFGKEEYRVYRVIDANGKKTEYWPRLAEWANGRKLVKLNIPLHPDTSCTGWCAWDVFWQCVAFYIPLLLLLVCCCCLPCCSCYLCYKMKKKKVAQDDEDDSESSPLEGEDEENSELDALKDSN